MANDLKRISAHVSGIEDQTLEGLIAIANTPHIKHLYESIKVIKYGILRDEFSFPEADPIKNSVNKAFHKGGDYYLSLLVRLIKRAPELMDAVEEQKEKKNGTT